MSLHMMIQAKAAMQVAGKTRRCGFQRRSELGEAATLTETDARNADTLLEAVELAEAVVSEAKIVCAALARRNT